MIKGLDILDFLTVEQIKLLETSEMHYKRFASIYFDVLDYDKEKNEVTVKVHQKENEADNYLSEKDLIDRTKGVFKDVLPPDIALHVRPIPYHKDLLANYSLDDINSNMGKLGLQQRDLVKLLNINKSNINRMFSGERALTLQQKAMFYYLFEYLKLKK